MQKPFQTQEFLVRFVVPGHHAQLAHLQTVEEILRDLYPEARCPLESNLVAQRPADAGGSCLVTLRHQVGMNRYINTSLPFYSLKTLLTPQVMVYHNIITGSSLGLAPNRKALDDELLRDENLEILVFSTEIIHVSTVTTFIQARLYTHFNQIEWV